MERNERMNRIRSKLSYANVVATLALVIAVAGIPTAVAVTNKPGKNSVTTKSIRSGNVTARDLADIRVVTTTVGAGGSVRDARATCAPEEKLISGGAHLIDYNEAPEDPSTALEDSYPDGNSWVVSGTSIVEGGSTIYALCLSAKPTKKRK